MGGTNQPISVSERGSWKTRAPIGRQRRPISVAGEVNVIQSSLARNGPIKSTGDGPVGRGSRFCRGPEIDQSACSSGVFRVGRVLTLGRAVRSLSSYRWRRLYRVFFLNFTEFLDPATLIGTRKMEHQQKGRGRRVAPATGCTASGCAAGETTTAATKKKQNKTKK